MNSFIACSSTSTVVMHGGYYVDWHRKISCRTFVNIDGSRTVILCSGTFVELIL